MNAFLYDGFMMRMCNILRILDEFLPDYFSCKVTAHCNDPEEINTLWKISDRDPEGSFFIRRNAPDKLSGGTFHVT